MGLERAGMQTVAFCEIEDYPRKVLAKHWPDVPIFKDIRSLRYYRSKQLLTDNHPKCPTEWRGTVDVVCGGWPCQTYSSAARGRNVHPDMLPDLLRIVGESRPRWVVAENVANFSIDPMFDGLERMGFSVRAYRFKFPFRNHLRDRCFFVANANGESESRRAIHEEVASLCEVSGRGGQAGPFHVGMDDGVPRRMDRLKALGNAVVPQIPEIIGRAIMEIECT